jgi:hypothetical protein
MRRGMWGAFIVAGSLMMGCAEESNGREETGLEGLSLTDVQPRVLVPGTVIHIEGRSFLDEPLGISSLRLVGGYAGGTLDTHVPATFTGFETMEIVLTPDVLPFFGPPEGDFNGQAAVRVEYTPSDSEFESGPLQLSFQLRTALEPVLDELADGGAIFVNDKIAVSGSGLLLGGEEGTTYAVVEGCFKRTGETECVTVPPAEVPVVPDGPFDREHATFPFSPQIAGIFPGQFTGTVLLRNEHADGTVLESEGRTVAYDLIEPQISAAGDGGSLGQYVDLEGGGFIGGDDGLTILRLEGQYVPSDAVGGAPVSLEIIPEFVDGRLVRYVINEQDGLGQAIDLRRETGAFDGNVTPIIIFGDDELVGSPTPITFRIESVRQVVYLKYNTTYVESLREFGLRPLDQRIRARIMEVLVRDYDTINVDFRTEEPQDYKLYATLEIAGPDPNGLGLLGYDNSPGKDLNNERLFDSIGGVNAVTQEDGFPGYGGVFIESLFSFSEHPPNGSKSEVSVPLFDEIFDPFRGDRGGEAVSSSDFSGTGIPVLTSGNACPAADRRLKAACAVWVLGSVVGSTVSHELGHSLGLADPKGMRFHNLGDADNRLMDKGGNRPFEERAELMGAGPSRYCVESYEYLREILPTEQAETVVERPHC